MNNYNFTQSLDGLNNIEADNINTSNFNVGSLVADNAEITTLSDSNLVNCTTSTIASQDDDLVNKKYVVDNFVDRANNVTQEISGLKTFTNNVTISNLSTFQPTLTFKASSGTTQQGLIRMEGSSFKLLNNSTTPTIVFTLTNNTRLTLSPTQFLLDATCFLTTNDMKSRAPASAHTLLSDISTGTLAISSATATNTINGNTTFTNNTNFTSTLLARTNIKLSEYENSPLSNNVTLTFPMPETIALRTTSLTNNNMTVTLPTLTNNERGYVFTFNKLLNPTYGNFNVTFQTSGGNYIFTLFDQTGTPTSNTTLLSIDKIQCKLAVGFFGAINYWVEQTDFSTFDRSKLQFYEWQNPTATNSLTLTFPLPPTIALRANTQGMMTITLPTLTTAHRGQIFTFIKVNTFKFDVTFNTSVNQLIFPLNNLSGIPTTNTTIFPSTKATTRLAVGWFSTFTYWIEVSDYSTFDLDENNLIYPRLTIGNTFTNINTFSSSLISNNLTSPTTTSINNIYTNLGAGGVVNIGTLASTNVVAGNTMFSSDIDTPNIVCNDALYLKDYQGPSLIYSSILVQNSDILNFDANFLLNKFQFKVSSNAVLLLDATNTTIYNNLVSNDLLAPSSTIAGVNNIYTNLSPTGYGVINIGAQGDNGLPSTMNQINIKSKLNIVESYYGTSPTKITTIQQEGDNCRFTNNGSTNGDFIFTIEESGIFIPLVINKTSVDIAGDAIVSGNLILYDTTPSTNTITTRLVGNDLTFNPDNTVSTTYNFDTNDSVNNTTTPLTISSDSVTINTNITHNQAQLLNKVKVISGTSATLTLPLEQTLMFSSTVATNITITMPELNESYHAGFTFHLIKTGSITNSVVFNRAGSNLLRGYGSITGATTYTSMINTDTIINVYTLEVSTGNFEWIFY